MTKYDHGKPVVLHNVSTPAGGWVIAMHVDGVLRTEVDLDELMVPGNHANRGPLELNHTYFPCSSYYDYVGAKILNGDSCTPKAATGNDRRRYTRVRTKEMFNPVLRFTALSPPTVAADNATEIGFMDLAPGDITLTTPDEPETWPTEVPVGNIFFHTAGETSCPPGSIPASGDSAGDLPSRVDGDIFSCVDAVKLGAQSEGIALKRGDGSWNTAIAPHGCSFDTFSSRPAFNPSTYPSSYYSNSNAAYRYRVVCMRTQPAEDEGLWGSKVDIPTKYSASARLVGALHVPCPLTHAQQVSDSTYMRHEGLYYTYDARIVTLTNTMDSPAAADLLTPIHADGCPNSPKTFLNQHTCKVTRGCEPLKFSDRPITLDADTVRQFYLAGGTYAFAVDGLRLEGPYRKSPCQSTVSRFRKTAGTCTSDPLVAYPLSRDLLTAKLEGSVDLENPFIRDIRISSTTQRSQCYAESGAAAIGAQIQLNGTCWEHVHPNTLNVYDLSTWQIEHPGNTPSFNPFKAFATAGATTITFPAAHHMSRWASLIKCVLVQFVYPAAAAAVTRAC